jgi:hypothetical protein
MPEFVIHVGPHKTGTTYLQLSMRAARDALLERGVIMPEPWEHAPGNPSHSKLAQGLRDNKIDALAPLIASMATEGARKVLISAEDLSNLDVPMLRTLRELIGHNPVRIVFYLRRWTELVPSSWQEGIKHGQVFTLPEFVLMHIHRPMASRLLNFDLKIAALNEVFGADNVSLVSYSELRDSKQDMFTHFARSFLAWEVEPPLPDLKMANASRDPRETELLRALNAMAKHRGGIAADRVRRAFDRNRTAPDLTALVAGMKSSPATLRFNDDWPMLKKLQIDLVAKYHKQIVVPKRPNELFRTGATDLKYVAVDWTLRPGVAAAMEALLKRLLEAEK